MKYKNILDMHTHTDNSFDAEDAAMYMCEIAANKELRAIAFTDHCEVDNFDKNTDFTLLTNSYFDSMKSRDVYLGTIIVCAGIELGQPQYNPELTEEILKRHHYDFVLAAIHNLRDNNDFYSLHYADADVDDLLSKFFDEELNLAENGNFDSLAHLTYPLRYITGREKIEVDLNKFKSKIKKILKVLAERDKALEINSSGLRQALGKSMPDEDLIRMFKKVGGKHITIGSDAHNTDDIGRGIEKCMDMAVDAGFKTVTLYQNREPLSIPIS